MSEAKCTNETPSATVASAAVTNTKPGGDSSDGDGAASNTPEPFALVDDAVRRALVRWPAGITLRALDPHVRWATDRSLSHWARTFHKSTRADLLRALPAVGAVDNIAGHTIIYPAASRERLRVDDSHRATNTRGLCEPGDVDALNNLRGSAAVVVVDSVEACRAAVDHIRRCGAAAFDCEGTSVVRPGVSSAGVALIQMAPHGGPCYLFDMCRPEPARSARVLMQYGGLGALLADRSVTKVVHDGREDARALAVAYGCQLAGVFDTQVVHMRLMGGDLFRPGLNALLAEYGLGTNEHKDAMRAIYPTDLYCWHRRPLPAWMVDYAVSDVEPLLRLKDALVARLLDAAPVPPWAAGLLPSPPSRSVRCWAVVAQTTPSLSASSPMPSPSATLPPMRCAEKCRASGRLPLVPGATTRDSVSAERPNGTVPGKRTGRSTAAKALSANDTQPRQRRGRRFTPAVADAVSH